MLSCREFVEFLDDYLAGELSADVVARFDEHLALCPSCVSYTQSYRATRELARRSLRTDALCDVPDELIAAILAAKDPARPS